MLRRTFTAVIPGPMTRIATVHYTGTVPVTTGFTTLGMLGGIGEGTGSDTPLVESDVTGRRTRYVVRACTSWGSGAVRAVSQ